MSRFIVTLFLIGFFMTGAMAQAQSDRVLNIEEVTSNNGLEFLLVSDPTLPIVTINFAFRGAGSVNDPADKSGLGQLTSNTMDEGAGERTGQEFQKALQDRAIELSFNNGRDHFGGKIKFLKRHTDVAVELLNDALTKARFDEEAVERMRNANLMRVKSSQSDTSWQAARLMNDVYFDGHPYAGNSGGTLSGLKSITADDMRDFVENYLTLDNVNIAVAGDVTADEAKALVDRVFNNLPTTTPNIPTLDKTTPSADNRVVGYDSDSPQSVVQMVWPTMAKTDDDYYALRVLNQILGAGGFSSLLMDEIREKRGLTYGIYSRLSHMDYANYLTIISSTSPENVAPMMTAIQDVLAKLKSGEISDEQIDEAKSYMIGAMPLRFSSTQSLSRTPLALKMDGLPMTYLDDWTKNVNVVTRDDLVRVASRIFADTDPDVTVIAGAIPEEMNIAIVETMPGVE